MTDDETIQDETTQPHAQPGTPPAQPSTYAAPRADYSAPARLADDPLRRSPFVAALLSLAPGLGQVYCGYTRLGFIHAVVVVLLFGFLALDVSDPLAAIGGVFLSFFWLYGIVDAWRRAVLVNQSLLGRLHLELPDAVGEPGFRGSLAGGISLVALGALLLSNTLFGVSLDWVEDWWPVVLIGFGAFLAWRALQDRRTEQA
jgi:hypothetical protein